MSTSTEHQVTPEQVGSRLDLLLSTLDTSHPRTYFQKLIEQSLVLVNELPRKTRYLVQLGDRIQTFHPTFQEFPTPENQPLAILFEDEEILVINKPAGLIVHPNTLEEQGTLVQALLGAYPHIRKAVYDPDSAISRLRPGIVHRLDKDTSGVMVIAKSTQSLQSLAQQFHNHMVQKSYSALLYGALAAPLTLHTKMKRNSATGLMGTLSLGKEGREAITHFEPQQTFKQASLVNCRIETGRTHQIRVHAKHCGHPVLGDALYTHKLATQLSKRLGLTRQMLHARELIFQHPTTGKVIRINAPFPEDMRQAITTLQEETPLLTKSNPPGRL